MGGPDHGLDEMVVCGLWQVGKEGTGVHSG